MANTDTLTDAELDAARQACKLDMTVEQIKKWPTLGRIVARAAAASTKPAQPRAARPLPDPRPVQASAKMRAANDGD